MHQSIKFIELADGVLWHSLEHIGEPFVWIYPSTPATPKQLKSSLLEIGYDGGIDNFLKEINN